MKCQRTVVEALPFFIFKQYLPGSRSKRNHTNTQETISGKRNSRSRLVHGTRTARAARNPNKILVGFRLRSNHQYGKQNRAQDRAEDRAHMRLDKRRSVLAFGSPASRRCAAGTCRNVSISYSRVLCALYYFFIFICIVYLIRRIALSITTQQL